MESQFLNIGRIDCSAFFEDSKEEGQKRSKKCFDLAHISLEELEQITFKELTPPLLKAAWCQVIQKLTFEELAEVSIPEHWIDELKDKKDKEVWFREFRLVLIEAWSHHLRVFESLIIYFNHGKQFTEDAFDTFLEALRKIENEWFAKHKELPKISLFLANHDLGDSAVFSLYAHFRYCRSLIYLDLDNNKLSESGAKALALFLEEQQSLKVLQLVGTEIGDEGLSILLKGIKKNHSLREVYLGEEDYSSKSLKNLEILASKYSYLDIIELCPKRHKPARLL